MPLLYDLRTIYGQPAYYSFSIDHQIVRFRHIRDDTYSLSGMAAVDRYLRLDTAEWSDSFYVIATLLASAHITHTGNCLLPAAK